MSQFNNPLDTDLQFRYRHAVWSACTTDCGAAITEEGIPPMISPRTAPITMSRFLTHHLVNARYRGKRGRLLIRLAPLP
jgi:hypothetical protein